MSTTSYLLLLPLLTLFSHCSIIHVTWQSACKKYCSTCTENLIETKHSHSSKTKSGANKKYFFRAGAIHNSRSSRVICEWQRIRKFFSAASEFIHKWPLDWFFELEFSLQIHIGIISINSKVVFGNTWYTGSNVANCKCMTMHVIYKCSHCFISCRWQPFN